MTETPENPPRAGDPATGSDPGVHLVTWISSGQERDALQAWLAERQLDPQVEWTTPSSVSFRLNTSDTSAVDELMRSRQDISWTVVAPGSADYVLRTLYVDAPDGRSFRFSDVPAATTIGSVADELVEQYSEGLPRAGRPVVIDRVDPDTGPSRLNPDTTLGEEGVAEGQRLRVSFEARDA